MEALYSWFFYNIYLVKIFHKTDYIWLNRVNFKRPFVAYSSNNNSISFFIALIPYNFNPFMNYVPLEKQSVDSFPV